VAESARSGGVGRSDGVPAVTAAIVVKDRRELLDRCLDGLLKQEVDGGFDVVVVDNGSADGTYELLLERATTTDVEMRVLQDRGSLGRIRNIAWQAASAPIVAFVDSDCVPAEGWLAAGLSVLGRADAAQVGVVQGRTLPDPTIERGRWSATQQLTELTQRYEACNIFYRVDALRAGGGFDEAVGFFGEDTAAGWSVVEAGWGARYEPSALVHHTVTHPGLGWHLRRAFGYGNINALVRRFPAMRTELLWHRFFLRSRNAAFAAAVLGLLLGARKARFLALSIPYAWIRKPKGRSRRDVADAAGAAAFDAAVFCGLVRGSIRERTLVL
jgi:glycosyltransferase involved in cell wall biosynthesis